MISFLKSAFISLLLIAVISYSDDKPNELNLLVKEYIRLNTFNFANRNNAKIDSVKEEIRSEVRMSENVIIEAISIEDLLKRVNERDDLTNAIIELRGQGKWNEIGYSIYVIEVDTNKKFLILNPNSHYSLAVPGGTPSFGTGPPIEYYVVNDSEILWKENERIKWYSTIRDSIRVKTIEYRKKRITQLSNGKLHYGMNIKDVLSVKDFSCKRDPHYSQWIYKYEGYAGLWRCSGFDLIISNGMLVDLIIPEKMKK